MRNWDSSRVSKQENVQVAAGKTEAMEFYKEFYNVATFFYRWCDPDDAEGKNCKEPEYKNKKNYLTTYNANGYCEGVKNKDYPKWFRFGGKVGDEDALAELDLGEADAMNHALSRQMGHASAEPPPKESQHSDGTWLDVLNDGMGVRRHEVTRENVKILPEDMPAGFRNEQPLEASSMTSMVYPMPTPLWLPAHMDPFKAKEMTWLGCKTALDPNKFLQADVMKYLNDTLTLWPYDAENPCDADVPITDTRRSGAFMIVILVLLIVIGLSAFALLLYRRLQEDKGRGTGSDARQVEMSAAINKPDDVETAPLSEEKTEQKSQRESHKW